MPISVADLLARVPAAAEGLREATVGRKRKVPIKTGGAHDRERFSADVKLQIQRAKEVLAYNEENQLSSPEMPVEERKRGGRKYWFDVYKGKILLQLYLGNLALLDKEALAEAQNWQGLIESLEAFVVACEKKVLDGIFAQRRKEAEEARAAARTAGAAAPAAAQAVEGAKPKRARKKAAS